MKPFFPIIFFFPAFLTGISGNAQVASSGKSVESVNALFALQVGIPSPSMQEATKNKMGNIGFGGGISVLSNPFSWGKHKRNSPLRIGVEGGYTYYGRFLTEVNINGYRGDFKTSYGILQLNALLHLRPKQAEYISPFIEILAGGSFYLSSTKENLGIIESSLGLATFNIDSYSSGSFNKGIAAGFSIGKPREDEPRFTLRVSYNRGGSIKYVVRNSLVYNASYNRLEYQVGRVPVNYFLIQVGVGI